MIDATTGRICFLEQETVVGPALSLEQFLASSLGSQTLRLLRNGPFSCYQLPLVDCCGRRFSWDLSFEGSILRRVAIACADPVFGSSWADWCQDGESARKRLHDHLLESCLGAAWNELKLEWGSIESTFDARTGAASIVVRYTNHYSTRK